MSHKQTVDTLNRRRTASAASDFEIMFLCESVRIFAICMRRYNRHFITLPKSANNLWLIDAHTWRDNTSQAGRQAGRQIDRKMHAGR